MKPHFLVDRIGAFVLLAVWTFNLTAGFAFDCDELVIVSAVAIVICLFWAALAG